ncbi:MAG: RidA family protein [Salinibacter sp.]|uniref:RidA family protein n=1 Tax=Salinibacter sp. TaxID=2065818 RepID=UPI002FC28640
MALSCTSGQTNDSSAQATEPDTLNYGYDVEQRIQEMGIELREPTPPTANYVKAVQKDDLIFLSGHGPDKPDGGIVTGKVGGNALSVKEGQEAARLTGISMLSTLQRELGDLNRVEQVVKVTGMVNAQPDFTQHSQVVNGFSDLMVKVFEDRGRHARAAVGMGSLPGNIPIEVEMIVEVQPE